MRQPKSNKIKKKELQEKARAREFLARNVPKPPIVHVLKVKVRNFSVAIEEVFAGKKFDYSETKIHNIINAAQHHPQRDFLKQVFLHFTKYKIDFAKHVSTLRALGNLCKYPDKAIRPISDWKPNSHNIDRQVSSFARHLYAKYEVPLFMDKVWHDANDVQHNWFIHVGQGGNIRAAAGVPIALTKKEAHLAMKAPRDLNVLQAFRYGQVLNIGGNEAFVRQILRTRIDVNFSNNEFWVSVFRWLLQNPMLDVFYYAAIVDFVHNQKFVPSRLDENGMRVAEQPNLTMKGRDPETLLRQVEAWHRRLGKERAGAYGDWASSCIPEFYLKNDDENVMYTITEILSQGDLIEEGKKMRHCVASYARSCSEGAASIWTFEEMSSTGKEKRLTIQVNNATKTIVQARGKCNDKMTASDLYYVKKWANSAGLSISKFLI